VGTVEVLQQHLNVFSTALPAHKLYQSALCFQNVTRVTVCTSITAALSCLRRSSRYHSRSTATRADFLLTAVHQVRHKKWKISLTPLSILKYGFNCPDFHVTQDAQHRQVATCCTELQPLGSEMRKVRVEISLRSQAKYDIVSSHERQRYAKNASVGRHNNTRNG